MDSPLEQTRHQVLLGDESFVELHTQDKHVNELREMSKAHRRTIEMSLEEYKQRYPVRNEAMARAYLSGAYTMLSIGKHFGLHYMTVSRAVRDFEGK